MERSSPRFGQVLYNYPELLAPFFSCVGPSGWIISYTTSMFKIMIPVWQRTRNDKWDEGSSRGHREKKGRLHHCSRALQVRVLLSRLRSGLPLPPTSTLVMMTFERWKSGTGFENYCQETRSERSRKGAQKMKQNENFLSSFEAAGWMDESSTITTTCVIKGESVAQCPIESIIKCANTATASLLSYLFVLLLVLRYLQVECTRQIYQF